MWLGCVDRGQSCEHAVIEGVERPVIVILTLVLVDIVQDRIDVPSDGASKGLFVAIYYPGAIAIVVGVILRLHR